MQRQLIQGIQSHDNQDTLSEYEATAPIGTWQGKLDFHAWRKSSNLFCYFTNLDTQEKCRLAVFSQSDYAPYNGEVFFDKEPIGGVFELETSETRNGNIKLVHAKNLSR